ncbi:hypothetical protein FFF34_000435 [Inquilinus sp. KBS0705]|nr:hypothetical protein FFF34_000435 [Inquilinus sp. KBS0705]
MFVVLACFVFWVERNEPTARGSFLLRASEMTFNGTVDSIYNDVTNHNTTMVILSDKYRYGLWTELIFKIELGDSLSKSKGSLKVKVFKTNGQQYIFDYKKLADSLFK